MRSESAIIALIDAKERISTMKGTMRLAERSVELANASYSAGVLNQIDVQDAELSLYNSRLGFQQSVYDYQVAKANSKGYLDINSTIIMHKRKIIKILKMKIFLFR
ncbi:MAG: TolC family protein [Ignavibacteria bacterium]|nr:TolC family protein [Ignavibacteria bacterium]